MHRKISPTFVYIFYLFELNKCIIIIIYWPELGWLNDTRKSRKISLKKVKWRCIQYASHCSVEMKAFFIPVITKPSHRKPAPIKQKLYFIIAYMMVWYCHLFPLKICLNEESYKINRNGWLTIYCFPEN